MTVIFWARLLDLLVTVRARQRPHCSIEHSAVWGFLVTSFIRSGRRSILLEREAGSNAVGVLFAKLEASLGHYPGVR